MPTKIRYNFHICKQTPCLLHISCLLTMQHRHLACIAEPAGKTKCLPQTCQYHRVGIAVPTREYSSTDTRVLEYRIEEKKNGTGGYLHAFPFRLSIFHFYDISPPRAFSPVPGGERSVEKWMSGGNFSFPSVKPPSSSCATSGNRARQRRYRQRGCLP